MRTSHRVRLLVATGACAMAVLVLYTLIASVGVTTHGFIAYYAASRLYAAGQLGAWVYDDPSFMRFVQQITGTGVLEVFGPNPPTMALLALPVGRLDGSTARTVWLVLSLFALASTVTALLRWSINSGGDVPPLLVVLLLLSPAVFANLRTAQAYLALFAMLSAAALCLLRKQDVAAGLLVGLMVVLKSSGTPLLLFLLAHRRFRAVAAAAVSIAGAVLLVALQTGSDMWLAYPAYVRAFLQRPNTAVTAYQTTLGWVRHFCLDDAQGTPLLPFACGPLAVLVPTLVVGTAVVVTLWASRPCRAELWIAAAGCLSFLVLPVAAEHHAVLLGLPLVFVLQARAGRRQWWWLAPFAVLFLVPSAASVERFTTGWAALLAYPRLYAGWLLWGIVLREMFRVPTQPAIETTFSPE